MTTTAARLERAFDGSSEFAVFPWSEPVAWLHPNGSCATTDSWYGCGADPKWTPLVTQDRRPSTISFKYEEHKKQLWRAASILVSAGTSGVDPYYEDGSTTPNRDLCLGAAKFLHQFLTPEPFDVFWRVQLDRSMFDASSGGSKGCAP